MPRTETNPHALDIGGQAVIEGVLMKSGQKLAIAVRLDDGGIRVRRETIRRLPKLLRLPLVRGVATLFFILILGIKALVWSANQSLKKDEELSTLELAVTLFTSLIVATVVFVGVPFAVTKLIRLTGFWFNVVEGAIRLALFVGYVSAISFMRDIRRLFQYHGAEHMAVNCYEFSEPLTVKNVAKYSTIHPRCGTSFIMLVLLITIVLYSFISTEIWYAKLLWRIALIPVVAGLSYEVLRLGGRFRGSRAMRSLVAPGMWVQRITTQKPDKGMIEVAIRALKAVTGKEKNTRS